jgi:hypothetical protein
MFYGDLIMRKKKKKGSPERKPVNGVYPVTEKYVNKVILADSPYLDKGVVITKKYLNPLYIDANKSIMLPPIKSPYMASRARSSEPQDRSQYESSLQPKKQFPVVENKYSHVKSRYMTGGSGGMSYSSRPIYYFYDCVLWNNGAMVKNLIASRSWWKERSIFKTFQPPLNFVWTGGIGGFNYDNLVTDESNCDPSCYRCINRFQNGAEINDKDNLFRNLWYHYKDDRKAILEFVPLTYSFRAEELTFGKSLQEFARFFLAIKKGVKIEDIKAIGTDKLDDGTEYDVYYKFDQEFEKGTKVTDFNNFLDKEIKRDVNLFNGHSIWMLKPSGLNRGRGLELFTDLDELKEFLKLYSRGYEVTEFANMEYNDEDEVSPAVKALMNKDKARTQPLVYKNTDYSTKITHFVIQKYIEKPMLYKNYKFDLRVFALMTHEQELLVFGDCYVRLSSLPYDPEKKNYLIHLTNNAVQVRSNAYGALVKGNIISIREFEKYCIDLFNQTGDPKYQIEYGHFMKKIKEVVKITFDSTQSILSVKPRQFNFELFGYDFMIDSDMKLWLIEVNSVPSLGESNSYISRLLNRAVDDMFKLTLDKIFPPPNYATDSLHQHLDFHPFPSNINMWEHVCQYPTD